MLLCKGGEYIPQVSGVLQRERDLAFTRRPCSLHAGQQVQRGGRLLRADRQETLQ